MSKNNWPVTTLDSVCDEIGDGIHGTPQYAESSEYFFVNGNNLKNGFIEFTAGTRNVDLTEYEKYHIHFDENTLFLSINGTLGSLAKYRGEPIILGKSAAYLKCKCILIDFLYYYLKLKHIQKNFYQIANGSTIKNLSLDALRNLQVPCPPGPTQKSIASVLSTLDAKIELNNRINAELETMAKTLYDYWFVQFDFPVALDTPGAKGTGHSEDGDSQSLVAGHAYRPYKSSGGKMVYNAELKREIPEGWEVGSLLDIADYTNGLACQKFRPNGGDILRVIKIKEMHEGFSQDTELVRGDIPAKVIIQNGDVLFSWSASLEVMIWTGGKGALNQHIFKVTSSKYPRSFYYFQLVNYLTHFKMMAERRKTTMGHITQDHLAQSRVVLPPKELALALEQKLAPMFQLKIRNEIENRSLASLRDWLLPMLMNGQVTVG